MKRRLFMRLSDKELETLCRIRDVVLGAPSYRSAIIVLCNSSLVDRLCLESLVETQLRRISVNLRQIERKLHSSGAVGEVVLSACEIIDPLIDYFSFEVSCLRSDEGNGCSVRRELSVRMTADEKSVVVAVKSALKFRNFRSLVLGLCSVAENRIMPPDFTFDYQALKEYGTGINEVAKALNSGKTVDVQELNLYLKRFMQVLSNIAMKISEYI